MSNPSVKTAGKPAKNRSKKSLSEKTVERINRGVDVFGLKRPKPASTTKKELPNKQTVDSILKAVKDALTKPSKVVTVVTQEGTVLVETGVEIRIVNTVTDGFHAEIKRPSTTIPGNRKSPLERLFEPKQGLIGHNPFFDPRDMLRRLPTVDFCHTETGRMRSPYPIAFDPANMPFPPAEGDAQEELTRRVEEDLAIERARADSQRAANAHKLRGRKPQA